MYSAQYDQVHQFLFFVAEEDDKDCFRGDRNVFVCGALQNPEKMSKLIGRNAPFAPASADGYRRGTARVQGKAVPLMTPSESMMHALLGVVWLNLTSDELTAIENLELKGDLRERIRIEVRMGERTLSAWTYVRKRPAVTV